MFDICLHQKIQVSYLKDQLLLAGSMVEKHKNGTASSYYEQRQKDLEFQLMAEEAKLTALQEMVKQAEG